MADFRITALRIDGERIPVENGHLSTVDGLETATTWSVQLDGARMLSQQQDRRVTLTMTLNGSGAVEGAAVVTFPGHKDASTGVYSEVRFTGVGSLERLPLRV
jgi:hypothetical protein